MTYMINIQTLVKDKTMTNPKTATFKEQLLPRVGLKPTTFSVLGWSSNNWTTEAAQLAEFKSPVQTNTKQGKASVSTGLTGAMHMCTAH